MMVEKKNRLWKIAITLHKMTLRSVVMAEDIEQKGLIAAVIKEKRLKPDDIKEISITPVANRL